MFVVDPSQPLVALFARDHGFGAQTMYMLNETMYMLNQGIAVIPLVTQHSTQLLALRLGRHMVVEQRFFEQGPRLCNLVTLAQRQVEGNGLLSASQTTLTLVEKPPCERPSASSLTVVFCPAAH